MDGSVVLGWGQQGGASNKALKAQDILDPKKE
jgi:hypothetical protein